MAKKVHPAHRRTAAVISMVTVQTKAEVERLAVKERISVSEVGRRAIESYILGQVSTQAGTAAKLVARRFHLANASDQELKDEIVTRALGGR